MTFTSPATDFTEVHSTATYMLQVTHSSGTTLSVTLPAGSSYYDPMLGNTPVEEELGDTVMQDLQNVLDASAEFSAPVISKTWSVDWYQNGTPDAP